MTPEVTTTGATTTGTVNPVKPVGPDFCLVQLTPDGVAFAKGSPLRISNGRTSLVFTAGTPTKIANYEWDMLLRDHTTFDGKTLFAKVIPTAATPAAPAAPVTPAAPAAATAATTAVEEKK
jgi:hypothetical protein